MSCSRTSASPAEDRDVPELEKGWEAWQHTESLHSLLCSTGLTSDQGYGNARLYLWVSSQNTPEVKLSDSGPCPAVLQVLHAKQRGKDNHCIARPQMSSQSSSALQQEYTHFRKHVLLSLGSPEFFYFTGICTKIFKMYGDGTDVQVMAGFSSNSLSPAPFLPLLSSFLLPFACRALKWQQIK